MENAGRSVSDVIARHYPSCKVLVFSGKGNNGGDGFVVARHLADRGYQPEIVLLVDPDQLKGDSLANFRIIQAMGIPVMLPSASNEGVLMRHCSNADLVVDAIFGTGLNAPVSGVAEIAICAINRSQRPVVSIDIPSGLNADTGEIHGVSVMATRTLTLALPKAGLFLGDGPACAGNVDVVDIGIPRALLIPFLD